ncbi:hypothetical protein H9L12_07540 [Sphingomonas rhizophila]|uniref:DUF2157 domain-containing protein n=1 Tax=Sphingomonas rhizophila TaxID=2071607 RepID=A0A7G9S8P8_9SPHN|nr:hypothetical protein [Sphingomonas rhizophila]QNN64223.1 hypothetical protein H9L12_07540 [Sphingomonas rhizophila]
MYSQQDLDEAVAAGAISAEGAASLRDFFDQQRRSPAVDEEQFRLINSFNDIFVSVASAILLFAVGWIGQSISQSMGLVLDHDGPGPFAPALIAATAWGLATVFTAKRRMALPSILLLLAFVGGVLFTAATSIALVIGEAAFENNAPLAATVGAVSAAIAAAGAYLHWRRFHVPITVAAGAAAVAMIFVAILVAILGEQVEQMKDLVLGFVLALGIGMFLFAMRWDSSDPARTTRRSDVAFWLHLLAAPMIVHPIFTLLGLNDGNASVPEAVAVVALYVVLGIAALAIDRRALLVSALAYVLYALSELFKQVGAVELSVAFTALVIGSALLLLSAYWHQARRMVVERLPDTLRSRLPLLDRVAIPQPAA